MEAVKRKPTGRPRKYDMPVHKQAENQKTFKERLSEKRETVVIPKPGQLVKTSPELCSYCGHYSLMSGGLVTCDYVLNTGEVRGCRQGECDKFCNVKCGKKTKFGFIPGI